MRAQEFITDALVHRAHVGSSDPNDIWHIRDDTTRKLRSRRNQVVLANAQPVVMSADAMRSRTYNIGPNTGKRYQLLGGYHYAYLQGDLKSQFPDNVDQGRQLWFKNGRFIYADTQEPFTSADYVHFASDRTVTAYNVEQGNKLKEALHFVRPGELRGSYSDQQMQQMGFRRAQNGAWFIDQRRWDALVQQGKLREQQGVAENFADGKVKGKSRPGRVKSSGASCNGSVTDLRKRAKAASGEKAKMYHWCANMKSGRNK